MEFKSLPCRHLLLVFGHQMGWAQIPPFFVNARWLKKANRTEFGSADVDPTVDGILGSNVSRVSHLHRRAVQLAHLVGPSEPVFKAVMGLIDQAFITAREMLDKEAMERSNAGGSEAEPSEFTCSQDLGTPTTATQTTATQAPDTQTTTSRGPGIQTSTSQGPSVKDPIVSSTKSRKRGRILSGIEQSQQQRQKKPRNCTECKGTNHDKRNCPQLKAAQQQQSSVATGRSVTGSTQLVDAAMVDDAVDLA